MTEETIFKAEVREENGECFIEIPQELIEKYNLNLEKMKALLEVIEIDGEKALKVTLKEKK